MIYEKTENGFLLSNDKKKLQLNVIHHYLSVESYWAKDISPQEVITRVEFSDCFGVYFNSAQVGFARVISDRASFGYLCDVFILEEFRGRGLSKTLMDFVIHFEPYLHLKRILLRTQDAHGLYSQFGFRPITDAEKLMEITPSKNQKG